MPNAVYIAYHFTVKPLQPATEILIAELGYSGFESFVENNNGVTAYIQKKDWHTQILETIYILKSNEFDIDFTIEEIAQTNWNATWEKNFNPIVVDNLVTVRAPFHKTLKTKYDIIIEPKMSFGTGHHETTYMMLQHILKNNFKNKSVLDMGCGTGVLAILAEKRGAKTIDAVDIDQWCYLNCLENIERNQCKNIGVQQGDINLIAGKTYDSIIANINRNILLQHIPYYAKALNNNGTLFLSGFYENDIATIQATCKTYMLKLNETLKKDDWVALKFLN